MYVHHIYRELGPEPRAVLTALSTNFYTRVFADDAAPWFRDMFADFTTLPQAIENQVAALAVRFGGPEPDADAENPHPLQRTMRTHRLFTITPRGLDRWMLHMRAAVQEVFGVTLDDNDAAQQTQAEASPAAKLGVPRDRAAACASMIIRWCEAFGNGGVVNDRTEGAVDGIRSFGHLRTEDDDAEK
jgi:truncated hemoglobin YjbI